MAIVVTTRMMVIPLRHVQMQRRASARERDIENAALLLESGIRSECHVRRDVPVSHVQHMHDIPLESLRGVHSGDDEPILVNARRTCERRRRSRRLEDVVGSNVGEPRCLRRSRHQRVQIGKPCARFRIRGFDQWGDGHTQTFRMGRYGFLPMCNECIHEQRRRGLRNDRQLERRERPSTHDIAVA